MRHTLRLLGRQPAFAVPILLTLALGIGATTALFSVVDGVLLRPLPWPEADRLVRVSEWHPGSQSLLPLPMLSDLTARAWSAAPRTVEDLAAWSDENVSVDSERGLRRLSAASVSTGLFRLLRARPAAGRFFTEEDAAAGAGEVVVLSATLARERFATVAAAVGRNLRIDGRPHLVVGVAAPGFDFPEPDVRLWRPLSLAPRGEGSMSVFPALARLRPGATVEQAAAEGTAAARSQPRPMVADLLFGTGRPVEVRVVSLLDEVTAPVRPALLVLSAGVLLLLLIACANVAHLFLAHGLSRRRELAVRSALGAGRGRLVRQLLVEALVLSLAGGGLGLALASMLVGALPAVAPVGFPRLDDVRVDWHTAVFALVASVAAAALAGLVPAVRGARDDLVPGLRDGEKGATSGRGNRLRAGLLVTEAMLSFVLLVGAGLLARSFTRLLQVDPGFDPRGVLLARLVLPDAPEAAPRRAASVEALLERVRATPGVVAAGAGNMAPFVHFSALRASTLPWAGPDGRPLLARARYYTVTDGYAEALGLRRREGRLLTARDGSTRPRPLLVNEAFVRSYLQDGAGVIGRQMKGAFASDQDTGSEVVGVVGNVLKEGLDAAPQPEVYMALGPGEDPRSQVSIAIRTAGDPARLAPVVRRLAREVDPEMAIDAIGTLASQVSSSVSRPRFATVVLGSFSALALALAAVGLYGALSYAVSQRRRELAIRAALGARRPQLLGMVVAQGVLATGIGLLLGALVSTGVTRAMSGLLFQTSPLDRVAFSGAAVLLLGVALVACLVPARRAAALDPAEVLRSE
jgi:putative ABC transport system permease protein